MKKQFAKVIVMGICVGTLTLGMLVGCSGTEANHAEHPKHLTSRCKLRWTLHIVKLLICNLMIRNSSY